MSYFPFMVEVEGAHCLIVGGGMLAFHKAQILSRFGAKITVVGKYICQELRQFEEGVILQEREFVDTDLEGMQFVVAATNVSELNQRISALCREKKIPVNVVDVKEECTFFFPAIIKQKDLLIAVSSGGSSPAAAAFVKQKIAGQLPSFYGDMVETLGAYRAQILQAVNDAGERKRLFCELLEYGSRHEGCIPETVVLEHIKAYGGTV